MQTPWSMRTKTGRLIRFGVVGASGAALNTGVLYALYHAAGLPLLMSSALAVELAVISNYLLNDRWTFAAPRPSCRLFAKFNTVSMVGLGLNVLTVWFLVQSGVYFLAANLAGILISFASNYAFSVAWVWRRVV
jgi:putative flippase GtrA